MRAQRVVGVVVLALASGGGLAACGDDGPSTVSVDDYTETFCDAFDDLGEVGDSSDSFFDELNEADDEGEFDDEDEAADAIEEAQEVTAEFLAAMDDFRDASLGQVPDDRDAEDWAEDLEAALDEAEEGVREVEEELADLDADDVADDPGELLDVTQGIGAAFSGFVELLFEDDLASPNEDYGDITEAIVEEDCFG